MIVLFGTKRYREVIAAQTLLCRQCGNPAHQRLEKVTTKFSLFFVPLLTISTKYTMQCAMCGQTSQLDEAEAKRLASVR